MNRAKYNKRQCINEHIFGIIKRQWGYDHTLMKGLKKVDAETGLIFTAFNIRRILNIPGTKKFIRKMKKLLKGPSLALNRTLILNFINVENENMILCRNLSAL
jgi:hypothetical protein